MESSTFQQDLTNLEWQIELGATEAVADQPVNRYELGDKATSVPAGVSAASAKDTAVDMVEAEDPVAVAEKAAAGAGDLEALRAALAAFEHCALKRGARNLVFSDGIAGAPVMIVGEAPGRDEDLQGKPFVGRAGQLLERMLAAIDLSRSDREAPVYITNVLPWRPPQNRDPSPEEIAMMRPFLLRHIVLAEPQVLVVMGNISAQALLGKKGITRLRGNWTEAGGVPAIPMFHPAYLLRNTAAKREAWADLLSLKAKLGQLTSGG